MFQLPSDFRVQTLRFLIVIVHRDLGASDDRSEPFDEPPTTSPCRLSTRPPGWSRRTAVLLDIAYSPPFILCINK